MCTEIQKGGLPCDTVGKASTYNAWHCICMWILTLVIPLPILLPINGLEIAASDWAPATHVGDPVKSPVSGFRPNLP